ncbi:MAG: hypothetical protein NZ108_03015, partial [Bacteroidia bacterium]|nr:hypothetical protein [Bacteroidia bacterium]
MMSSKITFRLSKQILAISASICLATACRPKDLINKTKYDGKKVVNTCKSFQSEVKSLIEANKLNNKLKISEYDNSQFGMSFLEPGQFEIRGETLYFRLINDLEYGKYLKKGVAIHVTAEYVTPEHLRGIDSDASGTLGTLVVDEAYYNANKDPYFVYKIPVGKKLNGKQVNLKFGVVQYKKGKIKKVFCNTEAQPLGPVEPAGVTAGVWDAVNPQSVIVLPTLKIQDEEYRYKGFIGTIDLIFPMSVYSEWRAVTDKKFNKKVITDVVISHFNKLSELGFEVTSVSVDGYASQGGRDSFNLVLSNNRAEAVKQGLDEYFKGKGKDIPVSASGRGEDWERFELLVKTVDFTEEERKQILDISSGAGSVDEKEAKLRELAKVKATLNGKKTNLWDKLVKLVLENCRHTLVSFTFEFKKDKMYVENYPSKLLLDAAENQTVIYNVANQKMTIGRYTKGTDAKKGLSILNVLIPNNNKPNLYAMRSTYHFGLGDMNMAIKDIESALNLDKNNVDYAVAALAYKTKMVHNYSMEERLKMLDMYNDYALKYPDNKGLYFNRTVMMDKVGHISGALTEYESILSSSSKNAAGINNRGVANMKTNRLVEAEADFI